MLDIYVTENKNLNLILVKNGKETLDNLFYGKMHNALGIPVAPIRLKGANSVTTIIPQNIIRKFCEILGTTRERATEFFKNGARTVDDLITYASKHNLTRKELNGCLHYDDLLAPIDNVEEEDWTKFFLNVVDKLEGHIVSSSINSRPDGNHSRMEVLLCMDSVDCLDTMNEFIGGIIDFFPEGLDVNLFENSSSGDSSACRYCRVKGIVRRGRAIICDVTIYTITFHPYPRLREHKFEIGEMGYTLRDDGLFDKSGKKISFRRLTGRDNPSDIDDIVEYIEKIGEKGPTVG